MTHATRCMPHSGIQASRRRPGGGPRTPCAIAPPPTVPPPHCPFPPPHFPPPTSPLPHFPLPHYTTTHPECLTRPRHMHETQAARRHPYRHPGAGILAQAMRLRRTSCAMPPQPVPRRLCARARVPAPVPVSLSVPLSVSLSVCLSVPSPHIRAQRDLSLPKTYQSTGCTKARRPSWNNMQLDASTLGRCPGGGPPINAQTTLFQAQPTAMLAPRNTPNPLTAPNQPPQPLPPFAPPVRRLTHHITNGPTRAASLARHNHSNRKLRTARRDPRHYRKSPFRVSLDRPFHTLVPRRARPQNRKALTAQFVSSALIMSPMETTAISPMISFRKPSKTPPATFDRP